MHSRVSIGSERNEFRRGDRVIAYQVVRDGRLSAPARSLSLAPGRKEKSDRTASRSVRAEVLYKFRRFADFSEAPVRIGMSISRQRRDLRARRLRNYYDCHHAPARDILILVLICTLLGKLYDSSCVIFILVIGDAMCRAASRVYPRDRDWLLVPSLTQYAFAVTRDTRSRAETCLSKMVQETNASIWYVDVFCGDNALTEKRFLYLLRYYSAIYHKRRSIQRQLYFILTKKYFILK